MGFLMTIKPLSLEPRNIINIWRRDLNIYTCININTPPRSMTMYFMPCLNTKDSSWSSVLDLSKRISLVYIDAASGSRASRNRFSDMPA